MKPWQILITTYLGIQVFGFYTTISILDSLKKDFVKPQESKSIQSTKYNRFN